jgi:hypothetical protein
MAIIIPILSQWNPQGLNKAMSDIRRAEGGFNKFKAGIKSLAVPAAATFAAITAGAFSTIKAAEEAQVANRRLANVLKQMGYANATSRVLDYADALSTQIGKEDESIKLVQAKLATFKNLTATINTTNGAFDRATRAAFDLAAAGFGEAEQSATQLGKALQDPIKGITALARSGVTFTNAEKEKIKALVESGKLLEAQDVLLKAIETQVGGTAEATATASEKMAIRFGEMKEALGNQLLPAFERITPVIEKVFNYIADNSDVFIVLAGVIAATTAAVIALNVALALNPFTWIVVGIGAVIVLVALAIKRFEFLKLTVSNIGLAIGQIFIYLFNVVADALTRLVNEFVKLFNAKLAPALRKLKIDVDDLSEVDFTKPFDDANAAIDRFGAANRQARSELEYNLDVSAELDKLMKKLTPSIDDNSEALESLKKNAGEAARAIKTKLESELDKAKSRLEQAKSAFDSFRDSVASPIRNIVNFGEIGTGANFLENLESQTQKAKGFAQKIQKLISMGLSESAIQQVLNAGFDAGSNIADQIIAGGASVVNKVNQLTASLNYVAESTGTLAATKFYQAGIDSAQNFVDGLIAQINASAAAIAKALADASRGNTSNPTVPTVTPPPGPPPKPKPFDFGFRANGGPVSAGFPYIVGERGPEIFMPSTSGSIMSNDRTRNAVGSNVTINVNAGNIVGSKEELLAFVQRGLREYDRRNGKLNING